jgi:hypothetical protein
MEFSYVVANVEVGNLNLALSRALGRVPTCSKLITWSKARPFHRPGYGKQPLGLGPSSSAYTNHKTLRKKKIPHLVLSYSFLK